MNKYWVGTPNYTAGNYGVVALFPHWIVGTMESGISVLTDPNRGASAHYVIGGSDVAQLVSEADSAWHCGNSYYNMRSISYELEGWVGNPPSRETLDTCAELMAQASRDHFGGAPLVLGENVMLHQWVSATACPGETDVAYLVAKANEFLSGTGTKVPTQPDSSPVNDAGFWYRAHSARVGWLNSVRDGQIAGTTGYDSAIECLKMSPPVGLVLDVKLHIAGIGWKTWEAVENGVNDPEMGTTLQGRALEGIEIVPTKNETGKTLFYRTHLAETGWTPWVEGGYASGSVGLEKAIEAIEIKLV